MPKVTCPAIEDDAGWAYRFGDAISETFPSHDLARKAAEAAARRGRKWRGNQRNGVMACG